jgi:hypothetical protein
MDGPTQPAGSAFYIHGEAVSPKEVGEKRHFYLNVFMNIFINRVPWGPKPFKYSEIHKSEKFNALFET